MKPAVTVWVIDMARAPLWWVNGHEKSPEDFSRGLIGVIVGEG
jgi:hypothetical protein